MTTTADALAMRARQVHQCEGKHAGQRCTATISYRVTLCVLCQNRKDKADRKVAQQRAFRQNKREREAQGLSTVLSFRVCREDRCDTELRWNNKSGICSKCSRRKRDAARMAQKRAGGHKPPPRKTPLPAKVTLVPFVPQVRPAPPKPDTEPAAHALLDDAVAQGKRLFPTRGFEIHERTDHDAPPMFRTTRIDAIVERGWIAHSAHTYLRGVWNVVDLKTPTRAAKRFLHEL